MSIISKLRGNPLPEQKVIQFDIEIPWDSGAPTVNVFSNEYHTFLSYYASDCEVDADEFETIVLVEFSHCLLYKFGSPNDEVLSGHPLYTFGLKYYGAHIVENSNWINELKKVNSIHDRYNEDMYRDLKHYIFCFHDSTFECISEGYKLDKFKCSDSDFLEKVIREKLKR